MTNGADRLTNEVQCLLSPYLRAGHTNAQILILARDRFELLLAPPLLNKNVSIFVGHLAAQFPVCGNEPWQPCVGDSQKEGSA